MCALVTGVQTCALPIFRADRHEGPVRHEWRADDRGEPYARRLRAAIRVHRVAETVGRGRWDAGQAEPRPVRAGVVERDPLFRQRDTAFAPKGPRPTS